MQGTTGLNDGVSIEQRQLPKISRVAVHAFSKKKLRCKIELNLLSLLVVMYIFK